MADRQKKSPYDTIVGQVEFMEGDTKVIVTEYASGAKSHRKIRPKRPFYKHIWFYILIVAVLYIFIALAQ
ncbi:hypothetical protein D3C85_1174980 [compost metagenome]